MIASQLIRQARKRVGLSKRELARRAHTSPAAIVEYESGRRSPTVATLDRIILACGLDWAVMFDGTAKRERQRLAGERLAQVLDLADYLPQRKAARKCAFPGFRQ